MGEPFWSCQFFLSVYPSSYSILILYGFFLKKLFWFWILKKTIWLDRRKIIFRLDRHFHSIIIYLPFSQYNHVQNFEEKKIIPALKLKLDLRTCYMSDQKKKIENREGGILFYLCPSFLPRYFSSHFSQQLLMAEIWYLVTSFTRYAISWEAFLEPSDSYFLFADFVDFYTHWTICSFFSATIDGRNLIFSHKLHIGTPYRGKRFWTYQIPTSCFPT